MNRKVLTLHAVAVEFDFVQPIVALGRVIRRVGCAGRMKGEGRTGTTSDVAAKNERVHGT